MPKWNSDAPKSFAILPKSTPQNHLRLSIPQTTICCGQFGSLAPVPFSSKSPVGFHFPLFFYHLFIKKKRMFCKWRLFAIFSFHFYFLPYQLAHFPLLFLGPSIHPKHFPSQLFHPPPPILFSICPPKISIKFIRVLFGPNLGQFQFLIQHKIYSKSCQPRLLLHSQNCLNLSEKCIYTLFPNPNIFSFPTLTPRFRSADKGERKSRGPSICQCDPPPHSNRQFE